MRFQSPHGARLGRYTSLLLLLFSEPVAASDYTWRTGFHGVGLDKSVEVLASFDGGLAVGGSAIRYLADLPVGQVAVWDGTQWTGTGVNPFSGVGLSALAEFNGRLYVHGIGGYTGPPPLSFWDGTSWQAVSPGFVGERIVAMREFNEMLFLGGRVWVTGTPLAYVFAFDGTSFVDVGNQPADDWTFDFAVYNGELYAAGYFTQTEDGIPASGLARYDGVQWRPVEGRSSLGGPLVEGLHYGADVGYGGLLAVHDGKLIVTGGFDHAGDLPAQNICAYDASTQMWEDVGGGTTGRINGAESAAGRLFVFGSFSTIGGVSAAGLAQWDGLAWSSMPKPDGPLSVMIAHQGNLVLGGGFSMAEGIQTPRIAIWDGDSYSSPIQPGGQGLDNVAFDLHPHGPDLFVAGRFGGGGDHVLNYIGRWENGNWEDLAGGANGFVNEMTTHGSDLVAIGKFTAIGGGPANFVARWDGTAWGNYGAGLPGEATAVCVHNGQIHAGGRITGTYTGYLKRWDSAQWLDVPRQPSNNSYQSLASYNGDLVAGASTFVFPGGFPNGHYVGRYDGVTWSPLLDSYGAFPTDIVNSLTEIDGYLYVMGNFSNISLNMRTAVWTGTQLSDIYPNHVDINEPYGNFSGSYAIEDFNGDRFLAGNGYGGQSMLVAGPGDSAWRVFCGGVSGVVFDMVEHEGRVFLCGNFTEVGTAGDGGQLSSNIAAFGTVASTVTERPLDQAVLHQNVPNPFNPSTTIRFDVPEGGAFVKIDVATVRGEVVRTLVSRRMTGGTHEVEWDGRSHEGSAVASGTYFYRLTTDGAVIARKMVLLK